MPPTEKYPLKGVWSCVTGEAMGQKQTRQGRDKHVLLSGGAEIFGVNYRRRDTSGTVVIRCDGVF